MPIKQLLQQASKQLINYSDTPRLDSEVLLSFISKKAKVWLYSHDQEEICPPLEKKFNQLIKQRQQGKPVAYLTKNQSFYGLNFLVNQDVLIPRPESEILIEQVLQYRQNNAFLNKNKQLAIADVGTGSGCLAITLAKHLPEATIYATDISSAALVVAKKNARRHKVKVNFRQGNLLEPLKNKKIDLIVANLPYLSPADYRGVDLSVRKYEPSLALLASDKGLFYYQQLLKQIGQSFPEIKQIFLEIDPRQSKRIKKIIKQYSPEGKVKIAKDLQQQDRVVIISP